LILLDDVQDILLFGDAIDIKGGHDQTHSSSHQLKSTNNQDDQRPEHHSL
jgi:hypothetical protein